MTRRGIFMKRSLATLVVVVLCLVPLGADLTFTQTMTVEGAMAAMMAGKPIALVTRVKGKKARADMEVMEISSLTDLVTREVTILNHKDKTAQVIGARSAPMPNAPELNLDFSFKPTGQAKAIDGVQCAEHVFTVSFGLANMSGQQVPSEAAEAMKDVRMVMDGSVWIAKDAPGAAEYIAFQKAALDGNLSYALGALMGGQSRGGMDKLMAALSEAPGLPYLTEMTMSVEGTGPFVEMMKKQMTGMKLVQKMASVSTEPLGDDLFRVPADYTVKK